jgi:hypothetical protein
MLAESATLPLPEGPQHLDEFLRPMSKLTPRSGEHVHSPTR